MIRSSKIDSSICAGALTGPQARFVDHLVATGCTPTHAARIAGYSEPAQEAYRLIRKPHISAAIRDQRERLISCHAASIAVKTLIDIMEDKAVPASARVSAARTVLEAAGQFDKDLRAADPNKPLHEMTEAELVAFLARADKVMAEGGARPTISVRPDVAAPASIM